MVQGNNTIVDTIQDLRGHVQAAVEAWSSWTRSYVRGGGGALVDKVTALLWTLLLTTSLAGINRAAATVDIDRQDLSAIDECYPVAESGEKIVALVEGGLPAFDDDTLAIVNRSAATIDITSATCLQLTRLKSPRLCRKNRCACGGLQLDDPGNRQPFCRYDRHHRAAGDLFNR